jgi:uncharacterized protein YlaI
MKITKSGLYYSKPLRTGVCPECDCEFELEQNDKVSERWVGERYIEVFTCPECDEKNVPIKTSY